MLKLIFVCLTYAFLVRANGMIVSACLSHRATTKYATKQLLKKTTVIQTHIAQYVCVSIASLGALIGCNNAA